MLEDLDLTYRISRRYPLAVNPEARLLHRASPVNRYAAKHYARNHLVHRYWFVLKNLSSPHCRAAFWWSVIGALLAAFASRKAAASAVTRGILLGIRDIVLRRDPLLR
jgi:GT2 family glycosyltransferase